MYVALNKILFNLWLQHPPPPSPPRTHTHLLVYYGNNYDEQGTIIQYHPITCHQLQSREQNMYELLQL